MVIIFLQYLPNWRKHRLTLRSSCIPLFLCLRRLEELRPIGDQVTMWIFLVLARVSVLTLLLSLDLLLPVCLAQALKIEIDGWRDGFVYFFILLTLLSVFQVLFIFICIHTLYLMCSLFWSVLVTYLAYIVWVSLDIFLFFFLDCRLIVNRLELFLTIKVMNWPPIERIAVIVINLALRLMLEISILICVDYLFVLVEDANACFLSLEIILLLL